MPKQPTTPAQLFAKLNEAWTEARGERALPRRADINPVKLGGALQNVFLLDVVPGKPVDFRYRLIGEQLIRGYGRNLTGESHLSNFGKLFPAPTYDAFVRCTNTKQTQESSTNFRNFNGTPCRALSRVWPLSEDGASVTGLLGGCLYLVAEVS